MDQSLSQMRWQFIIVFLRGLRDVLEESIQCDRVEAKPAVCAYLQRSPRAHIWPQWVKVPCFGREGKFEALEKTA